MRPPLPISVSKALDQLLALLKMSDYEADEYQERLEEHADRRFDPKSRRKIQSMGQRESKPSMHNLPGLNRKTMRDRDLSRNMNRKRAIMGLDLPSYHGFGGDDREIHPGDTSINEGIESGETGKRRLHGDLRVERAVPIESPEDLSRLFGGQSVGVRPGDYFYDDSFGSDDDDDDDESSDSPWEGLEGDGVAFWDNPDKRAPERNQKRPWTTSGPINYIPQTEEWVDSPFTQTPTFRGAPFNEETGFTKGNSKELKGCPINVGEAFSEAWDVLKMGFPPSNGPPSPSPSPPSKPPNGGGQEEYSHKDLDAESLIDFLIQTLHMDYQDAKVLVNHHKTKELAGASQRKAKVAAEETLDEAPPSPQMGASPMGMGKPPMGGPI